MNFPILSTLIFLPLISSFFILLSKDKTANNSSIYISHGTNDEVIPFNESIETNKILDDNNIDYVFESFDQGHGVNQENLKSFLDWLYKKY